MSHTLVSGGTLGGLVISAIARFGDKPAIGDDRIRWSYRELGEQIGRIITVLRGLGLGLEVRCRCCRQTAPRSGR